MRSATLFLCLSQAVLVGGCTLGVGGRLEACGEYPPGGGPAVIVTRDQELCEVVRLRVLRQLDRVTDFTRGKLDELVNRSFLWEHMTKLDKLLDAVRRDAGDAVADEVSRAVDSVTASSTRTLRPECGDPESCLVKGAARGLRLALLNSEPAPPAHDHPEKAPGGPSKK